MAASTVVTYDDISINGVSKVTIVWTSASGGGVAVTLKKIVGELVKAVTNPSATAPTDDYDIVITDPQGANVLGNCNDDLVDRDTANTEVVYFLLNNDDSDGVAAFPVVCDKLTVTVANAGDTKIGTLVLYYKPLK